MRRRSFESAVLAAAGLLAFSAAAASKSGVSFTAAQARQGAAYFTHSCAACHGAHLEGGAGPALTGPNFKTLNSKVHATVGDIFTYMTTNMPMNAPASLPHDQYTAIMAYILSKNGFKPGSKPLTYSQAVSSKSPIVAR